jgi:hypothetical protein
MHSSTDDESNEKQKPVGSMFMPYALVPVELAPGQRPLDWMGQRAAEATAKEQAKAEAEVDEGKQK